MAMILSPRINVDESNFFHSSVYLFFFKSGAKKRASKSENTRGRNWEALYLGQSEPKTVERKPNIRIAETVVWHSEHLYLSDTTRLQDAVYLSETLECIAF